MEEHHGFRRCTDRRSEYLTEQFAFKCKLFILTSGFIISFFTLKKASAENVVF